tara:strand:+ start:10393 stop:14022 length:3630 start_codon:yes stop_codon:yes gene_type:complete
MAEKYIMLECNRLRANLNYKNIDESEDIFKNRWVNNVNSYGIVVNPGDVISCESVAINTIGASDSTIEFTGGGNKNGFVDNKVDIEYNYYINDSGQNLIKLPLLNTETFFAFTGGAPTNLNNAVCLRNRQLGEPLIYGDANSGPIVPNAPFIKDTLMPTKRLVSLYQLDRTINGEGNNYRQNGIYKAEYDIAGNIPFPTPAHPGYGATFKVLEITNEEGKSGIPTKVQIWDQGQDYAIGAVLFLSVAVDGGYNPGITPSDPTQPITGIQKVNYHCPINPNFTSKQNAGPDGRRYFFTDNNYTGACLPLYTGMPNTPANGYTTDKLNPNFNFRSETLTHQVPIGLNTPDNIGTILTDQLHRPTRFDPTTTTRFFDYGKYFIKSKDNKDNSVSIRPPLISTPTYQPMPTNGTGLFDNYTNINCLDGAKKLYYRQVCYDDPYRIKGVSVFRQVPYNLTNDDNKNGLNSGSLQVPNVGDFANQSVGNLGLIPALLNTFATSSPGVNRDCVLLEEGDLILTNIYFTDSNLKLLSQGFKDGHKYFGLTTKIYDPTSLEFKQEMAMALDLGLYCDELSNGYPLNKTTRTDILQHNPGQRKRFKTPHEMLGGAPTDPVVQIVDNGAGGNPLGTGNQVNNFCVGTVPFSWQKHYDGAKNNDGQELSSIVATSCWRDIKYNQETDQVAGGIYYTLFNSMKAAYDLDTNKFPVSADWSIDKMFNNEYTDSRDNVKYNLNTLTAMAEKYDLMVVPVWPDNEAGNEFSKFGNRPYIAFRNHIKCDNSTNYYDTKLNGHGGTQKWQIDPRNAPYGIQIGYDPSFIRNNACLVYNTDYTDSSQVINTDGFNSVCMFGCSNPNISFDSDLSRFTFTGLNTPMVIGNGLPTQNQDNIEPNGNPEQQVYNVNTPGQVGQVKQGSNQIGQTIGGVAIHDVPAYVLNEDVAQQPDSFIDSLGGMAFGRIILYDNNNIQTQLNANGYYGSNFIVDRTDQYYFKYDRDILEDTLLGKMGFTLDQLLPVFGSTQALFLNPIKFEEEQTTYFGILTTTPTPMITAAFISSAEYQPTQTNSKDMPLYGLGTNSGLPSAPSVTQAGLNAENLPTKLDYPYLLIYSSIIAGGTNTEYYGGLDGKSKLPCIGYITRNYNEGDFFYGMEQSFNYTANKTFTLTDIETEIRLPDGTRPRLGTHNSIIYKITKPITLPNNNILPNNNKGNDKRRKDRYAK